MIVKGEIRAMFDSEREILHHVLVLWFAVNLPES